MDDLIEATREIYPDIRVTYNKHHIAVGTQRKNFAWFHPRKREGYCQFNIRVGKNNIEKTKEVLGEAAVPFSIRKDDLFAVPLLESIFKQHKEAVVKLFQNSCELSK